MNISIKVLFLNFLLQADSFNQGNGLHTHYPTVQQTLSCQGLLYNRKFWVLIIINALNVGNKLYRIHSSITILSHVCVAKQLSLYSSSGLPSSLPLCSYWNTFMASFAIFSRGLLTTRPESSCGILCHLQPSPSNYSAGILSLHPLPSSAELF
jgi:hypothetical protein